MQFGPTFAAELAAAGLGGLPLVWNEAGEISGRESLTDEQNAALDAVIAAHDPSKPAPYILTKLQITGAMTDEQLEEFYTLMNGQPLRMRRAWEDCQEVNSGHLFFAVLHWEMSQTWGAAEADRILSPR